MSRFTSVLCYCGAASSRGDRRSALFERLCLEARLRMNMGGGAQALVLYQLDPKQGYSALFHVEAYTVACAVACDQACLIGRDVIMALRYGFERVFVELCSDPLVMKRQMALLADVAAARPDLQGKLGFFNSPSALRALMAEEHSAPAQISEVHVSVAEGCTLCGACSWACPTHAIELCEGEVGLQITDAQCTGCGMCATACPEHVISLQPVGARLFG